MTIIIHISNMVVTDMNYISKEYVRNNAYQYTILTDIHNISL